MINNSRALPDSKFNLKKYQQAVERGNAAAMYSLGEIFSAGEVVEKDLYEAIRYYRLAVDTSHDSNKTLAKLACDQIIQLYGRILKEAIFWSDDSFWRFVIYHAAIAIFKGLSYDKDWQCPQIVTRIYKNFKEIYRINQPELVTILGENPQDSCALLHSVLRAENHYDPNLDDDIFYHAIKRQVMIKLVSASYFNANIQKIIHEYDCKLNASFFVGRNIEKTEQEIFVEFASEVPADDESSLEQNVQSEPERNEQKLEDKSGIVEKLFTNGLGSYDFNGFSEAPVLEVIFASARQGNIKGLIVLAELYSKGQGVIYDPDQAIKCYRLAIQKTKELHLDLIKRPNNQLLNLYDHLFQQSKISDSVDYHTAITFCRPDHFLIHWQSLGAVRRMRSLAEHNIELFVELLENNPDDKWHDINPIFCTKGSGADSGKIYYSLIHYTITRELMVRMTIEPYLCPVIQKLILSYLSLNKSYYQKVNKTEEMSSIQTEMLIKNRPIKPVQIFGITLWNKPSEPSKNLIFNNTIQNELETINSSLFESSHSLHPQAAILKTIYLESKKTLDKIDITCTCTCSTEISISELQQLKIDICKARISLEAYLPDPKISLWVKKLYTLTASLNGVIKAIQKNSHTNQRAAFSNTHYGY